MDQPLPDRLRHASRILSLSMLIMGVCGIIYEYNLGVLGNNLMGSSYEQIFVVIGIMMFAMGVGAALQRRIAGHLIDRFIAIEFALGFLGGIAKKAHGDDYPFHDLNSIFIYESSLTKVFEDQTWISPSPTDSGMLAGSCRCRC